MPEGTAYDQLIDKVRSNDIIRGKLLSDDGDLALVVLALDPDVAASANSSKTIADIRKTVHDDLDGTSVQGELSGVPVMQLEVHDAVERDRLLYNAVGFGAGCLIAILFFRRVSFMIVAAGPPLIAILLALGALGWMDFRLNMFLNVMTPLIMVISFSDSMQLTFAARDRLIAGETKVQAFRNAVLVVGPACVLTHATAALSFTALLFTKSDLIHTFGEAGLLSTVIALLAVLMLVPLLGILLVRDNGKLAAAATGSDTGVQALRRFCAWIAARMVSHPGLYSLAGIVVVASLGFAYAHLQPSYRLAEQVPDKEQAVQASGKLDAKLTGANPIDVLIEFPAGQTLYSPETLAVIADVHKIVERQAGLGNVWSIETLRRWLLEKAGRGDVDTLKQYVGFLPKYLVRRFIDEKQDAVLVSARIPDKDASELIPVVDQLDHSLDQIRAGNPGYTIAVTGLSVIAARNSGAMIEKLNRGLTLEFLFVAFVHRAGVPLRRRGPRRSMPSAGHLRGSSCVGNSATDRRRGVAVRQRRGPDRVVRSRPERHDPFPESLAAGGRAGSGPGNRSRARDRPHGAGVDPDIDGPSLRPCHHRVLRPTVSVAASSSDGSVHSPCWPPWWRIS